MKSSILIFDLDGTLSDPREGITRCMRHALTSLGVAPPSASEMEQWIGPPLTNIFADLLGDAERTNEAVRLFRDCYGSAGLLENQLYPGIADAIATLHGIAPALMIATTKPRVYAQRIVEHFQLHSFFRAVHGCELTGERADKAELLAYLLENESLRPADVVMIGDRKHDVLAARAHGITSVGVTWGFGSAEELATAGADTVCASASELVDWYRSR